MVFRSVAWRQREQPRISQAYKIITFIIIAIILATDFANSLVKGAMPALSWHDLVLIALLIFIAAGERISRLVLGGEKVGLTLEQQVHEFREDLRLIDSLGKNAKNADLENLLQKATNIPHEIWSTIIFYRLLLRAVLRNKCFSNGIQLGLTTSLSDMLRRLTEIGVIDSDLNSKIRRIVHATFAAEWGEGELPTEDDLKFVLEEAPKIIRMIHKP